MVCQQNVQYIIPNRIYISHKISGDDTPGHPITKCIIYTTEIGICF